MVYYVALENEFAHCTCLGFWRFHLSGNQAIYSMVAVEERDNLKSYVEILKSRNLKNRILKSYVYLHP